ncbi:hypothetical protein B0E46_14805 [Rhodanobacter sp. B04]|uniref:hypothetical protein n=1 Tax=Rhodanobacter sp. B04 TaxID=1945860 RepID=UPI000984B108|nr:hypothetical protein [Rhodanobacter sp. B04]OOG61266.1 hypothetical protein B0E46_14805 [Rhodanobacter sp. B04]
MNFATILRAHPWLAASGMLAGLLVIVLNGFGLVRPLPGSGSLMRWHDASHDWLLVADDRANQLIVYDATDGRPLQRLGPSAVGDVAELAQHDGRLFVIDDDGTRNELKLPQLKTVASSAP